MKISELYQVAKSEHVPVIMLDIPECGSMCIQTEEQNCYIGMDREITKSEFQHRVHLAHEIGHCCTGSFYNRWAACDVRQKHENRADKWAIEHLISPEELDDAVAAGYTEIWSLAEHFGVTEDFMRKAVCWYTHGNLAEDLYF